MNPRAMLCVFLALTAVAVTALDGTFKPGSRPGLDCSRETSAEGKIVYINSDSSKNQTLCCTKNIGELKVNSNSAIMSTSDFACCIPSGHSCSSTKVECCQSNACDGSQPVCVSTGVVSIIGMAITGMAIVGMEMIGMAIVGIAIVGMENTGIAIIGMRIRRGRRTGRQHRCKRKADSSREGESEEIKTRERDILRLARAYKSGGQGLRLISFPSNISSSPVACSPWTPSLSSRLSVPKDTASTSTTTFSSTRAPERNLRRLWASYRGIGRARAGAARP